VNVRELIDVLGAGDLDAEVYVTGDGRTFRPLAFVDEVLPDDPVAVRARFGEVRPPAVVFWPADAEEEANWERNGGMIATRKPKLGTRNERQKGRRCKRCSRCQEWKRLKYFGRSAKRSDGRQPYCKRCFAAYKKTRRNPGRSAPRDRATRTCLVCGRAFWSEGPWNRRCEPCSASLAGVRLPAVFRRAAGAE